jgi:lactate permease
VLTVWTWLAAVAPVVVLFGLVASGRVSGRTAAVSVAVLTALLAATVFEAGPATLLVAAVKGLWLGGWILYVVLPAMLLYRLAERAGLDHVGELFEHLFPNRSENLLVLAWLLPSFVQGVAGFGTPIAVAAPLLLASGWSKERAVAYPLIGYHWSVTFGSMGSSYYMAALTAHLSPQEADAFALSAALMLGANCLLAGALVLVLDGGWRGLRDGLPLLLGAGLPMAATLVGVTSVVPAIGSVAAGAVGFACAIGIARFTAARTARPSGVGGGRAGWLVAPYLYLIAVALAVLLVPPVRAWAEGHLVVAPDLAGTVTGLGWHTEPSHAYTPLRLLTHPGTYLLLACLLGYLTYRLTGLWRPRPARELARAWASSVSSSSVTIVALACVTTVMIHAGMVSTLARGAVSATGSVYPALAPVVGALGSFLTGSTTSSNALFSSLQTEVAELLGAPQTVLLAAQTAGANVGNSLAPMVMVIGIGAVGGGVPIARVLRVVLVAVVVLLLVLVVTTSVWVALAR